MSLSLIHSWWQWTKYRPSVQCSPQYPCCRLTAVGSCSGYYPPPISAQHSTAQPVMTPSCFYKGSHGNVLPRADDLELYRKCFHSIIVSMYLDTWPWLMMPLRGNIELVLGWFKVKHSRRHYLDNQNAKWNGKVPGSLSRVVVKSGVWVNLGPHNQTV